MTSHRLAIFLGILKLLVQDVCFLCPAMGRAGTSLAAVGPGLGSYRQFHRLGFQIEALLGVGTAGKVPQITKVADDNSTKLISDSRLKPKGTPTWMTHTIPKNTSTLVTHTIHGHTHHG